ncbi:MAG: pantoate--beta-alanine ligase, partial [Nevskiales bacterium]
PDVALFGEKDYQQLFVIRCMVRDLHLPIEIVGVPTVRDENGLALSSRNQYLSAEDRRLAPAIYRCLSAAAGQIKSGNRDFEALREQGAQTLQAAGFRPDYFEILRPDLTPPQTTERELVILVAAWLGKARLLDNLRVSF